ncbi:MAG: 50S ribosomal protein L30 [Nitrospirae bacterium RIFCSPLOWO2_02_FULL_62_14]|nr:MAG: 50S ribosomal protein L30 [Nitrospirae bacterium RIFCSPLOWO2_02_FULL_62_14]OGW69345.1 MAG: 50S ribosomal protein L30 [Nitrospirae bacterium RIFCSPLOWO2_01_FULL_62_17]OGW86920.1 MAG: 50S ribosomal protein L30 [Nitrospirae bacterium RIFCSPLOWO2_12_FULL_63_8]
MVKNAAAGKSLSITLKRSPIGTSYRHRLVLQGLGLRKPHQTVVRPDTPQVRGLVGKVSYLLEVKGQ